MSNIFKIYINSYNYEKLENELKEVYIFIKNSYFNNNDLQSIEELHDYYGNNIEQFIESELYQKVFIDLFDDLDKKYIQEFKPKLYFINENIYEDDTVETIKFKFIKHYNKLQDEEKNKMCYEELYLFGIIKKSFNPLELYNILTNFNKNKLVKEILFDYLSNVNEQKEILETLTIKDYYDYDDLYKIKLKEINIFKSIGQSINSKFNYSYSVNPYKLIKINNTFKTLINNSINTLNSNNLFEYNLICNTLFVTKFKDVIEYNNIKQLDDNESIIKLYYPLLVEKNILSLESYNSNIKTLLKKTEQFIDDKNFFQKKNDLTNVLHNIYFNSDSIENKIKGIININFNIHSKLNLNLSLDSLFKLLNSTKQFPFIKFNPGNKMENIYRFYCDKISKKNKKIPLLEREKILKYLKIVGKANNITIVINIKNDLIKEFVLEIDNNGIINIKMDFTTFIKIDELNIIIKKYVNRFFDNLLKNIPHLHDNINFFESLFDPNIEILNINYKIIYLNIFKYNLTEFNKIKTCVSNLLNSSEKSDKTTLKYYRYKKVSNYNETNAINAFIIENIKLNIAPIEIVNNLKNNFDFKSIDEAKEVFESTIQSLNLVENLFNYKKLKIKNNPGFPIQIEKNGQNIEFLISSIDNINYIRFINLYFDSLIKLILLNNNELTVYKNIDYSICKTSNKVSKEANYVEDNVDNFDNNKINKNFEKIETNEIDLDDILSVASEPNDNLLDILLDDDDDDEDEDEDKDEDEKSNNQEIITEAEIMDEDMKIENKTDKSGIDIDDESKYNSYDDDDDDDDDDSKKDFLEDDKLDNEIIDDSEKMSNTMKSETQKKTTKKSNKSKYELNRLGNYETILFKNYNKKTMSKEENVFFSQYSRSCQHKRQPIIITQEEKDEIDKISPSSYKYILKYKTSKDKTFYYICPQFWDKNRNISLTQEQVKSGKFGKIGSDILDRKRELLPRLMSKDFQGLDKDFCLPCCYNIPKKAYNLQKDKKTLKCLNKTEKKLLKQEKKKKNILGSENSEASNYSSDSDDSNNSNNSNDSNDSNDSLSSESNDYADYSKYSTIEDSISNTLKKIYITTEYRNIAEQHKVYILPMIVSNFLQYDSTLCFEKGEGNFLKPNHRCLLKYGVEKTFNNNQTFVSCIADVYSKYKNLSKTISVKELKKIIMDGLTIDDFINYNNGNLTHIFLSKNIDNDFFDSMNIDDEYKDSKFYNFLDLNNVNQVNLYKKIINSFENFKKYLKSNNHIIDHTYLWDIVCKPNKNLFEFGINLIILDITSEDITQNIKVICPKSNYSNEFIDPNKLNLILIKNHNIFEPIYGIKDTSIEKRVISLFTFNYDKDEIYLVEFKKILNILRDDLNEKCISHNNIEKYDFEKNISLTNIIKILYKLKYEISYQIMNYENKIIGLMVNNKESMYFIPCYPSNSDTENNIEIKFMDDGSLKYNTYQDTKDFLQKIYEESKNKIKINPKYKILEEGLIVGILTNGDQMVLISPYEIYNPDDELPSLEENNYLIKDEDFINDPQSNQLKSSDLIIQTKYNKDEERINSVTNIKLESGFYNSFKNSIKKLLKNPLNNKVLIYIQKIINDYTILYFEKLRLIQDELRKLALNNIVFIDYDPNILKNIKKISTCMNNNCDTDFCMKNPDNTCSLIIQKTNLITNNNNEEIYYVKLADEFIRNTKTKIFLFENKNTLISNIKYNIDNNELVLLHSSINNSLFDKKFLIKNDYENYTNYDDFNSSNKILLEKIDTDTYKPKQKSIVLDSIQEDKKIKIKIPKLQMDTIKEIQELSSKNMKSQQEEQQKEQEEEVKQEIKEQGEEQVKQGEEQVKQELEQEQEQEQEEEQEEQEIDEIDNLILKTSDKCKSKIENSRLREAGIKENFSVPKLYNIFFTLTNEEDINCSYELFILLLNHFNKNSEEYKDLNIISLKNILIQEYCNHENVLGLLINSYQYVNNEIYMKFWGSNSYKNILEELIIKKYKSQDLSNEFLRENVEKIINNEKYYLTYIDIYLLSKKYNLPIIFITSSVITINSIKSATNIKKFMVCNINEKTRDYYFIKLPSIHYREKMKINQLIHKTNSLTFNIDDDINNFNNMNNDINESIRNNEDIILESAIITENNVKKTKVLKKYSIASKK